MKHSASCGVKSIDTQATVSIRKMIDTLLCFLILVQVGEERVHLVMRHEVDDVLNCRLMLRENLLGVKQGSTCFFKSDLNVTEKRDEWADPTCRGR